MIIIFKVKNMIFIYYFNFMGLLLMLGGKTIKNKSCLPTRPCLHPCSIPTEVRAWETQHLTIISQGF